jgi:hypothetical protein
MSGMTSVGRVVFVAGFALSVVTVPLDVYFLAKDSKALHENAPSDTSRTILSTISQLEQALEKLRDEELDDWQLVTELTK